MKLTDLRLAAREGKLQKDERSDGNVLYSHGNDFIHLYDDGRVHIDLPIKHRRDTDLIIGKISYHMGKAGWPSWATPGSTIVGGSSHFGISCIDANGTTTASVRIEKIAPGESFRIIIPPYHRNIVDGRPVKEPQKSDYYPAAIDTASDMPEIQTQLATMAVKEAGWPADSTVKWSTIMGDLPQYHIQAGSGVRRRIERGKDWATVDGFTKFHIPRFPIPEGTL